MSYVEGNIIRDGTGQNDRYLNALAPENMPVDSRDEAYWLRYAAKLAEGLHYYNSQNQKQGNWSAFFPKPEEVTRFLADLSTRKDVRPQLALFLAFNKLLSILRKDINQLTEKHLLYYYHDYLRFPFKPAEADQVNVVFELSKTARESVRLEAGRKLQAGKGPDGKLIEFALNQELIVNAAQLTDIRTVMVDHEDAQRVYAAPIANSADGLGKALPPMQPYWPTFGESQAGKPEAARTMPYARVGLAIASPIFLLREGTRHITITIQVTAYGLSEDQIDNLADTGVDNAVLDVLRPLAGQYEATDAAYYERLVPLLTPEDLILYYPQIQAQFALPLTGLDRGDLLTAFTARGSGAEAWADIPSIAAYRERDQVIRLELSISPDAAAIEAPTALEGELSYNSPHPVIELLLNGTNNAYLYHPLRYMQVEEITVEVRVEGVADLVLSNADAALDPNKAFIPFGAAPRVKAPFYIGSREVFSKALDSLHLAWSWADLPADELGFSTYYAGYDWEPQVTTNAAFAASVAILDNGEWREDDGAAGSSVELFRTAPSEGSSAALPLETEVFEVELPVPTIGAKALPDTLDTYNTKSRRGFVRLELARSFGHEVFSRSYAKQAILKAASPEDDTIVLPNPPYTPKLTGISLRYTASTKWTPGATNSEDEVFQILPFGYDQYSVDTDSVPMLPDLASGECYLGIENLDPPQNLSLLLQLVEGSADPTFGLSRNDVEWAYLAGDEWVDLVSGISIVTDTTRGLQTSGVVQLSLGTEASLSHTRLPAGKHWLRAKLARDPRSVGKLQHIATQAMVATRIFREEEVEGFAYLPPQTVKKLAIRERGIKKVQQPYPSFGGRPKEELPNYLRRVSERLRHRMRGITSWDFEHLVLEAFPSIYKAKCIPHLSGASELVPGACTIIVIPDLRNLAAVNKLEPKASSVLRDQVRTYLQPFHTPFANIAVENPHYEQLLVDMQVGLRPGFDGAYYGSLLDQELQRFLSPWAFDEGEEIAFGGKVYLSRILQFVESRLYVDFVTNFKLYQLNRIGGGIGDMCVAIDFIVTDTGAEEVQAVAAVASTARSILVSASQHHIRIVNPEDAVCRGSTVPATGIGAMVVEVDLIVV